MAPGWARRTTCSTCRDGGVARRPSGWIDQKNGGEGFVWHQVIRDGQGKNRAVLQIWGNESESFREQYEREVLWRMAPHIIKPLRFVLPHHQKLRPAWLLRLGDPSEFDEADDEEIDE